MSDLFSSSWISQQYHASSDGYLNVFQPLLGYFFGVEVA
jgi:hypothetical protein